MVRLGVSLIIIVTGLMLVTVLVLPMVVSAVELIQACSLATHKTWLDISLKCHSYHDQDPHSASPSHLERKAAAASRHLDFCLLKTDAQGWAISVNQSSCK